MSVDLDVHLDGIAAGDAEAFASWLAGAEEPLRRSLRSFATTVDVEAALQEGLLRVWQVAPRVTRDGKPNSLLRFALRVCRNAAIDAVRRHRVSPVDDVEHPNEISVEAHEPDPMLRKALLACIERLPRAPARVLAARLGPVVRSDRELAATLDMKLNTFLKNVGRARALLADCLRRSGIEVTP